MANLSPVSSPVKDPLVLNFALRLSPVTIVTKYFCKN